MCPYGSEGPFKIISRNTSSLESRLDDVLDHPYDALALQEIEADEEAIKLIVKAAADAGAQVRFSEITCINKKSSRRFGRRAAILVRSKLPLIDLPIDPNDTSTVELSASGRWVEVAIPTGDGNTHCILANYYGVSGSSSNAADCLENSRYIGAAIIRQAQFPDVPYFIATDLNQDPTKSEVVSAATNLRYTYDIPAEWCDTAQPTFCRPKVYEGMTGSGCTRIDTILANRLGTTCVTDFNHCWHMGRDYDHVPLGLTLDFDAATATHHPIRPTLPSFSTFS